MKRLIALALLLLCFVDAHGRTGIVVGSKRFNESYILAEIFCQLLESEGYTVERRFGLGGTLICYEAIRNGEVDVYPEYSGTLEQAILESDRHMTYAALRKRLADDYGLALLEPLGFNNTYAIAVRGRDARALGLKVIGDLAGHHELHFAFTHEFMNRKDGWRGLSQTYGLDVTPVGIEHGLAYEAMAEGRIDVTDVYSTDGDIEKYGLVLLDDDRGYFPTYLAAPLVGSAAPPGVRDILGRLAGRIDDDLMRRMNARVLLDDASFAEVAQGFLEDAGVPGRPAENGDFWRTLARRTATHLKLTLMALVAGILVAMPLGMSVYRKPGLARAVIYGAGVLQTVPSIALLALMIPLFGIGALPAVVALFVYALLPILRNTTTALFSIDPVLRGVATGMGLTAMQRLRYVELPLATPTILAGIKTAAVINIGTATLAAFIGAGGLGEPIVTGLALNNVGLIMQGAVPAALLAVVTELLFELIERLLVPRHLSARSGR